MTDAANPTSGQKHNLPKNREDRKSIIRLRGIRRVFMKGDIEVVALDTIDLDVREGEFLAVMGTSGSGKSTLMHLLGGLDKPTSGSYELDGVEMAHLDDAEMSRIRNRKIGFVFQTFNLLSDNTASDNISLPLVYAGVNRADRAMVSQKAGDAMGIGNRLSHRPTEISGGQVQRVAIARALANGPRLILADEPTGNLDSTTGAEIMSIFHRLHAQGATIIMVTHDQSLARYADRIIHLSDGDIIGEEWVDQREHPEEEHHEIRMADTASLKRRDRLGLFDMVRMGLREGLWAHKMRTFLTMLGVMFGVAAVIAIVSVAEGAKKELVRHIEAMGANTVRISARELLGEALTEARSKGSRGLTLQDVRGITEVLAGSVKTAAPMKKVNADIIVGTVKGTAEVWGTTPEYVGIVNFRLESGAFFTDNEMQQARTVCVLGRSAADELFGTADPIGEQVTIGRTTYDVIGVLARKPVSDEDLNKHIYVPLDAALRRVKSPDGLMDSVDRILLAVKENDMVQPTAALAGTIIKRNHFGVDDFEISVPEEKLELQQKTRKLMNYVLGVMAAIALLVGGIGIMNIMLATVTERTREIGIRRSVGATQKHILYQFLTEAVGISFAGGLVGIGLGFVLGWAISRWGEWASASFSVTATLIGFIVAVSVGLIFGIYPAWIAAKQDPIQALRYE